MKNNELIQALQTRLIEEPELRAEFHRQWKKRHQEILASGVKMASPMRLAVYYTRDRWLRGQRGIV